MDEIECRAVIAGFEALDGAGATAIIERDVVSVTGPDSGRYLQGQLSQEIVALAEGASAWSLLLQPTGKVQSWLRVHRIGPDDYALDVDPGHGADVVARLGRFLLRTKAEIGEPLPRFVLARRHGADRVELGREPDGLAAQVGVLAGAVAGPGVAGVDRVLPPGTAHEDVAAAAAADGRVAPSAAFERHRIAHGVPAMGSELTDDTIPAEAGQWLIDASVSFTKGCYTGQELVARIDSRGNTVPRPIRLLRFDEAAFGAGDGPARGAMVHHDDKEVGRVTSPALALGADHVALALGPISRAVPVGATVLVASPNGTASAVIVDPSAPAERP